MVERETTGMEVTPTNAMANQSQETSSSSSSASPTTMPTTNELCISSNPVTPLSAILPPLKENCRRIYLLRHGETDWNVQGRIQGGGFDIPLNANGIRQAHAAAQLFVGRNRGHDTSVDNDSDSSIPVGIVVSSHLKRAHETATIIWNTCRSWSSTPSRCPCTELPRDIQWQIHPQFGEMNFGVLEGFARNGPNQNDPTDGKMRKSSDLLQIFESTSKKMRSDWDVRWPEGGESIAEVQQRSWSALSEILQQHSNQRHIVIVSHGRTNRVLLASLLCKRRQQKANQRTTTPENAADGEGKPISLLQQIDKDHFFKKQREIKQGNTCVNVVDVNSDGEFEAILLDHVDHVRDFVIRR